MVRAMAKETRREESVIGVDIGSAWSCIGLASPKNDGGAILVLHEMPGNLQSRSWLGVDRNNNVVYGEDSRK